MEKHLGKHKNEIGSLNCPKCDHPIFHLRRFKHVIQEAHERVNHVLYVYYISMPFIELRGWNQFNEEIAMTTQKYKQASKKLQNGWANQSRTLVEFGDFLLRGAAKFLKIWRVVKTCSRSPSVPAIEAKVMVSLFAILARVLCPSNVITHQLVEEVQRELHRLENYLYHSVMEHKGTGTGINEAGPGTRGVGGGTGTIRGTRTRIKGAGTDTGARTKEAGTGTRTEKGTNEGGTTSALRELARLLDSGVKLDKDAQLRLREFMQGKGKADVDVSFSTWERFQPRFTLSVSRGSWFPCPQGHVYYWVGGAGDRGEGKCPFCDPLGAALHVDGQ
ncbi:uncharacterized protein LOC125038509 [Penaeus chinensis]|uniref:uncharacterized protein LOC125038509 n=1 Tax=Penaeus chinensis TaxID=139456 RepID=UPI001FB85177|nr:uncharacterized protein LOC125038509 [Penaeus chinensis]